MKNMPGNFFWFPNAGILMTASRHLETLCLLFHNVLPVKTKSPFTMCTLGARRKGNSMSRLWINYNKKINSIIIVILDSGMKKWKWVAQSYPTLCDPIDCSLPGSSVHGIFQAIALEWISISFSRGSSQPRAWTQVFHIVDRSFTVWATREVLVRKKKKRGYN